MSLTNGKTLTGSELKARMGIKPQFVPRWAVRIEKYDFICWTGSYASQEEAEKEAVRGRKRHKDRTYEARRWDEYDPKEQTQEQRDEHS